MNIFQRLDDASSTVEYMHALYPFLNFEPAYQREAGIWSTDKCQQFIDSLINGFDTPKIYFNNAEKYLYIDGERHFVRYDVIDGKQRLQALERFLNDIYPLSEDSRYRDDEQIQIGGLTYSQLAETYPDICFQLMRYRFDIIVLDVSDEELVDEFFLRLNNGVPLNAQEKRNACGCFLRDRVSAVAESNPFVSECMHRRLRYRNEEVVAKFFLIIEQLSSNGRILDTRRMKLDMLYRKSADRSLSAESVRGIEQEVIFSLKLLRDVFYDQDDLLVSLDNVMVFFVAASLHPAIWESGNVREMLLKFEKERKKIEGTLDDYDPEAINSILTLDDYNSDLQSINDGYSLMHAAGCVNGYLKSNGNLSVFADFAEKENARFETTLFFIGNAGVPQG